MTDLRATYRLQLRSGFDLDDAAAVVPYLHDLGISHVYASPLTTAREGSTHGYDVCAFDAIDPALGGAAAFGRFVAALHDHAMGLLLDFVPNHMAASFENPWWRSLLEWGRESPYADYFDIDWQARAGATPGTLLLPVLGEPCARVLEEGQLACRFASEPGGFELRYFDNRFPLTPASWPLILGDSSPGLDDGLLADLAGGERAQREAAKARVVADTALHPRLQATADAVTHDRARLQAVLEAQPYRLAHWRTAAGALNYRRFFDINELVGLRVDRPATYRAVHDFVLKLIAEGSLDGLRIDHVDGLRDPTGYLERLRHDVAAAAGGRDVPIYVEKILGPDESLPPQWPVAGTTGYEMLNLVARLFLDPGGEAELTAAYGALTGAETDFPAVVEGAKRFVLARLFPGELTALARQAAEIAAVAPETRELTESALCAAVTEIIVAFDVYRSYAVRTPVAGADRVLLERVFARARVARAAEAASALTFLQDLLLDGKAAADEAAADFLMRLQQLTGPVMAKALEDTAFYRYQRLVSLNEVGGAPDRFAVAPDAFHAAVEEHARRWPQALVATSTHDTKFGEDVRARLAALSEMAGDWRRCAAAWLAASERLTTTVEGEAVPEAGIRYRLFQILVGAWPPDLELDDAASLAAFRERLQTVMRKTVREAKQKTSWRAPHAGYEAAVEAFVSALLDVRQSGDLLREIRGFAARAALTGAVNGLAQTLLKLTLPGVPDIYQGSELWDLNLVDPDNRRPVDFGRRMAMLGDRPGDLAGLLADWRSGAIKQRLIQRALALRGRHPALFARGSYRPLRPRGPAAEQLLAYARILDDDAAVVVVPRLVVRHLRAAAVPLPPAEVWAGSEIGLPDELAGSAWHAVLEDDRVVESADGALPAARILERCPVALLQRGT